MMQVLDIMKPNFSGYLLMTPKSASAYAEELLQIKAIEAPRIVSICNLACPQSGK